MNPNGPPPVGASPGIEWQQGERSYTLLGVNLWRDNADGSIWLWAGGSWHAVINGTSAGTSGAGSGIARGGPSWGQMLLALAVLAGVTLLVPERIGRWIPWAVLIAYGARKSAVVNSALKYIGIGGSGNAA